MAADSFERNAHSAAASEIHHEASKPRRLRRNATQESNVKNVAMASNRPDTHATTSAPGAKKMKRPQPGRRCDLARARPLAREHRAQRSHEHAVGDVDRDIGPHPRTGVDACRDVLQPEREIRERTVEVVRARVESRSNFAKRFDQRAPCSCHCRNSARGTKSSERKYPDSAGAKSHIAPTATAIDAPSAAPRQRGESSAIMGRETPGAAGRSPSSGPRGSWRGRAL